MRFSNVKLFAENGKFCRWIGRDEAQCLENLGHVDLQRKGRGRKSRIVAAQCVSTKAPRENPNSRALEEYAIATHKRVFQGGLVRTEHQPK